MKSRHHLLTAVFLTCSSLANAAYIFSGADITENFDGMPTATVASVFSATAGVQSAVEGTGFSGTKLSGNGTTATGLMYDNGGSTSGGVFNYGTTSATDRALGVLASGSNVMAFGFELVNSTGATLDTITISFNQETWRTSTSVINTLAATYATGAAGSASFLSASSGFSAVTALDIVGPAAVASNGAVDGNANQVARSYTFTGLNIAAGDSFYLRWQDVNDSGNDAGLAIDDLVISAVPEPSAALLGALGLLGILRRRR